MGLSRRAYAAHRKANGLPGSVESAVRKAIASGRISVEADGTIDPVKADRQWELATNPSYQRDEASMEQGVERARATNEADERKPVPQAAVAAVRETHAQAAPDVLGEGSTVTYAKARAAREAIAAQTASLRLKKLKGDLVDRRAVEAHVFDLARKERDSWLQLPARVAANMAAELDVDAHAMEQLLDRVIRDHLAEMAEIKIELAASV